jgi:hypothetical protein
MSQNCEMPHETEQDGQKPERKTISVPFNERLALSVPEFAACCGHARVWGYRQVYLKRVKVLSLPNGEMMIPRTEVEAYLGQATEFEPKPGGSRRGRKPKEQSMGAGVPALAVA